MEDGWEASAGAWIDVMGDEGDWGRKHVLDAALLARLEGREFSRILDVGCGEGRFCRMLPHPDRTVVGLDPTEDLIACARDRDPHGDYQVGTAEQMPFPGGSFDLIVSYLSLIDISGLQQAVGEFSRVLRPGGTVLIANLTSFRTASLKNLTNRDESDRSFLCSVDRYMEEFWYWSEWSGIRVKNWHRPLSAYMSAFLQHGFELRFFDEPLPGSGESNDQADAFRRAPFFVTMEWQSAADPAARPNPTPSPVSRTINRQNRRTRGRQMRSIR
ncbi:MAG: class I SAM-dependent methyltransferase [Hyphomicrobiales bacterium]|nr:class I SAM-dependent methyltransferase [Hyphomicrobiales bacterium]